VGGLENLKEWLATRAKAFSKAARDFGLPMPRGILLVGLPGCGKSLSAKAASNILGVPLLRFDIGKVFGGLVGESERNMRQAIQTAEAVGNCVLWIDEMEKAFAGMGGGGSNDGGTSQRVFGNFITWMQEKTAPVFIISTVNRIESLPPELLRKGRFDEMFFVGLPSEKERKAIFEIHLKRYGKRAFSEAEVADCVKSSEGFSGAEIEEAVVSGLYAAFNHERQLEAADVLKAVKATNPLSKSKKAELEAMQEWAEKNAINASRVEPKDKTVVKAGRQLEL
jgi:SpoVK/Ycf46/Vps4 family AAA+-type ATPase